MRRLFYSIIVCLSAATAYAANAPLVSDSASSSSSVVYDTIRSTFADGKIAREYTVLHGTEIRDGIALTYHPNGKVAIEAPYHKGKLNGVFRSYYENGKFWKTIGYKDGVEEGYSIDFHENGVKRLRESYKKGVLNGVSEEWDEKGVLRRKIPYVAGQMHGVAQIYDELGALKEEMTFERGIRQGEYRRYKQGVKVMEALFQGNRCVQNCNF